MKTLELNQFSNYTIDLTPAIPFLDACWALEHLDDIVSYQLWCDHHDLPGDSSLEDVMELIMKWHPHAYRAASDYVMELLMSRIPLELL